MCSTAWAADFAPGRRSRTSSFTWVGRNRATENSVATKTPFADHQQQREDQFYGHVPPDIAVAQRPTATRMTRASVPPSECSLEPNRTVSGPSNGWRSSTSRASPGAMPCWDR